MKTETQKYGFGRPGKKIVSRSKDEGYHDEGDTEKYDFRQAAQLFLHENHYITGQKIRCQQPAVRKEMILSGA